MLTVMRLGVLKLAASGLVAAASNEAAQTETMLQFEQFKAEFGRVYPDNDEEQMRLQHFQTSLERIHIHNARLDRTYEKGLNQFSDMSDEEFSAKVLMTSQNCSATHRATPDLARMLRAQTLDLPARIDWRERGVISEVKNQGHCGSCWTFSTTGCLEAHMAIKTDTWHRPILSEQQLVDCAQDFDNAGCNGGLPSHAFEYIKAAGGLDTEFHYPYKAVDGTCAASKRAQGVRSGAFEPHSNGIGAQVLGGSANLTVGDEDALKAVLAEMGPVSIAFQVAVDFRDYKSGVYTSTVCKSGAGDVNHAVLVVGYGTDPATGLNYWLVKNSWDYVWGVEGFFKIEAFKNMCGVADCMAFPDVYNNWGPKGATVEETLVV